MKIDWKFLGAGGGDAKQKPSLVGVWIFSGTAQLLFVTIAKQGEGTQQQQHGIEDDDREHNRGEEGINNI